MKFPAVQRNLFMWSRTHTHYIIASDLKLCEVSIYIREHMKFSVIFLANKILFNFSRFSFNSVVSITYVYKVFGIYATSFIRFSSTSFKNLKF